MDDEPGGQLSGSTGRGNSRDGTREFSRAVERSGAITAAQL
jgi:hypothetical protein